MTVKPFVSFDSESITVRIDELLYQLMCLSAVVTAFLLGFKMAGIIHIRWLAVFSVISPALLLLVVHKGIQACFFERDEEHYYGE